MESRIALMRACEIWQMMMKTLIISAQHAQNKAMLLRTVLLRALVLRTVLLRALVLGTVLLGALVLRTVLLKSFLLKSFLLRSFLLRTVLLRTELRRAVLFSAVTSRQKPPFEAYRKRPQAASGHCIKVVESLQRCR